MDERDSEIAGDAELDDWLHYAEEAPRERRRRWDPYNWIAIALGVITLIGLIALWPSGRSEEQVAALSTLGVPSQFHAADVVAVVEEPCPGVDTVQCFTVDFELVAGPDVGFVLTQQFPTGATTPDFRVGQDAVMSYIPANGSVREMTDQGCSFDPEQTCRVLSLVVGTGSDAQFVDFELFPGDEGGSYFVGSPVMVQYEEGNDGVPEVFSVAPESPFRQYRFADFERRNVLWILALVFGAVVVALGRWRGLAALGGLVVSVAMLLLFVLPAILEGQSPVLVAVVGAAGIAFVALYLAHGFNRMTTVALVGTLATLVLIALLSAITVAAAEFTGFVSEESSLLTFFEGVDVRGLLLAGIVLGAAGAIDDVTVTQASAVWELRRANEQLTVAELVRSGLRIGRDHIASMVNTLLLAYAGASLPLLVLFVLSDQSLGAVANSEVVAVEIVRTLVGSIGLVAAVPFTTWLAAIAADGSERRGGHAH